MGQLCFREEQDIRSSKNKAKKSIGATAKLIDQAPSKQMAYRFQVDNFENIVNEKKYFYSMFFYNKIQKKILKLSHVSQKKSNELSPNQIQKLCASLGQYISYLQTIQEKFQLYDQVYEESEKGYLESDAYSMTFDDSLRNINYSHTNNPNSNGQGNSSCGVGGLSAKKLLLAKTINQGNNNEESGEAENNDILDNNQSTQSTNNYNQILPKFDAQEVKDHLLSQRMSALKSDDDKQFEDDIDKMISKVSNSCGSVLLYDMGTESDPDRANSNNNKNSGHFSNCDKEQHLQTINEESNQVNNLLFNSNILAGNSLLQLGDSNILSQISINDLQNFLPNYEVSQIFGRISERLEQPLLILELHKLALQSKTRVSSFRVQVEVLFEDCGKRQKQTFSTLPLYQSPTSTNQSNFDDISINEVFEYMSEINLSCTSYTKFRVSIFYVPLAKGNPSRKGSEECSPKLRNKAGSVSSNSSSQMQKQNKANENGTNNGGFGEDKQMLSCGSSASSSSSHSSNNTQNQNNKNITSNEDTQFNNMQENSDLKQNDEIKLSSQVFNLKDYMDQEIHYLNLKFTNKSVKQKVNLNPIKVDLQARFQFVYDQRSLVNSLMNNLSQQKTILEEIFRNICNNNTTTAMNNQK